MQMLRVKNWERFQHYKKRNPPWIKLHREIFASEDWTMLADASKLLMVVCMVVASRNCGTIPNNPAYLRRVAYLDKEPNLKPLLDCGFLEIMQAYASAKLDYASTLQANACPERETEGEREKESKKAPKSPAKKPQRIPDDWTLSGEDIVAAKAKHPNLDIPTEIEKFRAHHMNKGRPGLNWRQAFMVTWLLNAETFNPGRSVKSQRREAAI